MHTLAQKNHLRHQSQGKGDERFITVFKRVHHGGAAGARIDEEMVEAQYKAVHAMGYSFQNRGVGLGFGSASVKDYKTAPPPKSLLRQCKEQQAGLGPAMAEKVAAEKAAAEKAAAGQGGGAASSSQPAAPPLMPPPHKYKSVGPRAAGAARAAASAASAAAPAGTAAAAAAPPPSPPPAVWLYVSTLLGASSQFSASDHSARQLLGPPAVYPKAGSSVKAWSAVPREGQTLEWVRVAFKRALHPSAVVVVESANPGSVVALRGTAQPRGAQASDSEWFMLWSGSAEYDESCASREFRPPLLPGTESRLVSAVEVCLDTSGWTADWWSEIDAVRLEGTPPRAAGGGASTVASSAVASLVGAAAGGGSPSSSSIVGPPWLKRQFWESDRAYEGRIRFDEAKFGPQPPPSESEALRRAALSMVYQNSTMLGTVYPSEVEASLDEVRPPKPAVASSGLAVEGQLRAQAEQRRMAQ